MRAAADVPLETREKLAARLTGMITSKTQTPVPEGMSLDTEVRVGFRVDEHGILTVTVDVAGQPAASTVWQFRRNPR